MRLVDAARAHLGANFCQLSRNPMLWLSHQAVNERQLPLMILTCAKDLFVVSDHASKAVRVLKWGMACAADRE